jgi:hypothetical protein
VPRLRDVASRQSDLLKGSLEKQVMCETEGHIEARANETATLAGYVADLKFEDIPRDVLARAKGLTLDFLGSAIRAVRRDAESTPSLLKMLEALALDGKGHSTVFGDSKICAVVPIVWTGPGKNKLRLVAD